MKINLNKLAEDFCTPLYIYEKEKIKKNCNKFLSNLDGNKFSIHFAIMCNKNPKVLNLIKNLGLKIQASSLYEISLAKRVGFTSTDISFTSTGISRELMKKLIDENIQVNLDSIEEVKKFCDLKKNGKFGIRVRIPKDFKIISSQATNTFSETNIGIEKKDIEEIKRVSEKNNNKIVGIHGYIASNILDEQIFKKFGDFLSISASDFPDLEYINFGSGFGINYSEEEKELNLESVLKYYLNIVKKVSKKLNREIELKIEPGRFLLANSGVLLVKVTNVKRINNKKSEICINAGFGEIARPMLYSAYHKIENVQISKNPIEVYDIRANSVLQNDFLGKDRKLRKVKEGDFLLIKDVGAYGIVMASGFPGKELPKEVLV